MIAPSVARMLADGTAGRNRKMIVTVDGPAGAGKSSVSKAVAERFGLCMLDTGATYRTCALAVVLAGGDPRDRDSVLEILRQSVIRIADDGHGRSRMRLDGRDVTDILHTSEIDLAVTPVCQVPEVREAMVALQRGFADGHDTICEGRDMGTVVFPNANLKIWLTASAKERAHRRALQFGGQSVEDILADIERRDRADARRELSPMVAAEDAVTVNTTGVPFDDVVDTICHMVEAKMTR